MNKTIVLLNVKVLRKYKLQSWTEMLRHFQRLGKVNAISYFVYPPPPFQCCFKSKTILLQYGNFGRQHWTGGGGCNS